RARFTSPHSAIEDQRKAWRRGRAERYAAVEARTVAAVAGDAVAGDPHLEQDRVLVAVDAELADSEGVAALLALPPQPLARAAEEPGLARGDGAGKRLGVHVRHHEGLAGVGVAGYGDDQSVLGEARRQRGPSLDGFLVETAHKARVSHGWR